MEAADKEETNVASIIIIQKIISFKFYTSSA